MMVVDSILEKLKFGCEDTQTLNMTLRTWAVCKNCVDQHELDGDKASWVELGP